MSNCDVQNNNLPFTSSNDVNPYCEKIYRNTIYILILIVIILILNVKKNK